MHMAEVHTRSAEGMDALGAHHGNHFLSFHPISQVISTNYLLYTHIHIVYEFHLLSVTFETLLDDTRSY